MSEALENGARRGTRVRCPSCTALIEPEGLCPTCLCRPVPPERYGVARMLLRAGVDRYALPMRVATQDLLMARLLEERYASQWAWARGTIEALLRVEPDLLQRGLEEQLEDRFASMLPWDLPPSDAAQPPAAPEAESLEAWHERSTVTEVRWTLALAAVNRGHPSRTMVTTALESLRDDGFFGVEATLALTRWRVAGQARIDRWSAERIDVVARNLLATHPSPDVVTRAAMALLRFGSDRTLLPVVRETVRRGLDSRDADIRFQAALMLNDEAHLLQALDTRDAEQLGAARRALAGLGSRAILEQLEREGDDVFALDVLRNLPHPRPEGAVRAVLAVSARVPGGLAQSLRNHFLGFPFADLSPEDEEAWTEWARSTLGKLPADEVLRFVAWVAAAPGAKDSEAGRAFEDAASKALEREPPSALARHIQGADFVHYLALAGSLEESLLCEWSRLPECTAPLMDALVSLPGRLGRWDASNGRAASLLQAVWEASERERIIEPLTRAVKDWSGVSGREELIDFAWRRFQSADTAERATLLTVFEPWERELWERQVAAEVDPLERFNAWWEPAGPMRFPDHVRKLLEDAPAVDLPRRLPGVWDGAEARVDRWPRSTSLAIAYAAAPLCNALREGKWDDVLVPQVERFLQWFPDMERRIRAASPTSQEPDYRREFLEDIHVDVRLMREYLERLRENEEQERQAELQRRVEESRRRDQERQRELQRRQQEEEAQRRQQELQQNLSRTPPPHLLPWPVEQTAPPLEALQPQVPGKPIDIEVILPGAALPTLRDYVGLLKAMTAGAPPLELWAARGMTPETWSAEVNAWAQALMKRQDLGLRFAELLAAPWK